MADELTETKEKEKADVQVDEIPRYHVILLNDDDHTYDYVVEMLHEIFGHDPKTALDMAIEVDTRGQVIVDTTHKERAEFKKTQIKNYGPDWRLAHSEDSMQVKIEPADN